MFGLGKKRKEQEMFEKLQALGTTIAKRRDEAVSARKESGIEEIWKKCEDAYLGIDDANRNEFAGAKWAKSTSISGPVSTNDIQTDNSRSTAFVRLTSRYVDFASAKLSEIALPMDDKAFAFEPTPIPELVQRMKDESPLFDQSGQPVMGQGPDGQPVQMTAKDEASQILGIAKDAAKKAETRIYDWMMEGRHANEMRKVIHDSVKLGAGVLKGPIPDKRKSQAITKQNDVVSLVISENTVPVTKWVDVWNLFPDPACGENVLDGDYIIERDFMSSKRLRTFRRRNGWNTEMIDKVLAEGPNKSLPDSNDGDQDKIKKLRYSMWHYYGMLKREELECAGVTLPDDVKEAYAIVTLVNDSIVRCILNPLDSGKFPYHVFSWSRRAGHWAGVGVAEQIFLPQRMVNAATRAVLENAGISAGIQILLDRGLVEPADKTWSITRNKIWFKKADAIIDDVRKAFHIFEIPNVQAELMPIVEYAMRLAEEHSSIPMVSQGQYANNASPQTYGQAELQNTNALTLLRDKGIILDDSITEPVVEMFYEWLLLDADVPVEEKGDFKINAHGTVALIDRAIQEVTMTQALQLSLNPAFGADPEKAYALWLKTKRVDKRDVMMDEEQKAAAQQQEQPQAPQVQAAQIRAEIEKYKADKATELAIQRIQTDTDRDAVYVQAQTERDRNQESYNMQKLVIEREIALLKYANDKQINLDKVKADLAKEAMSLRVTKELAGMEASANMLPTPPIEPPGRAEQGHSYTQ